ncbi:hypothetical protein V6N13_058236 [Hibiscus sabdariffa]
MNSFRALKSGENAVNVHLQLYSGLQESNRLDVMQYDYHTSNCREARLITFFHAKIILSRNDILRPCIIGNGYGYYYSFHRLNS